MRKGDEKRETVMEGRRNSKAKSRPFPKDPPRVKRRPIERKASLLRAAAAKITKENMFNVVPDLDAISTTCALNCTPSKEPPPTPPLPPRTSAFAHSYVFEGGKSKFAAPAPVELSITPPALESYLEDLTFVPGEVVVQANGLPRQAGATQAEGEYIKRYKRRAEQSLFIFLKGVLGRDFLTAHFHRETCHFIQKCPPFRKLVLMPREHAKTTIVAGGLPAHILIQPSDGNIYFPGLEGSDCRILLAGETANMAQKNLRVVKSVFMENKLFRAFWAEKCWENERQAPQWSNDGIIIPRKNEWPDPSIRAIGVGGAVTGSRPNVMIKDDLISFDAARSDVVMTEAIEWHKASRALLDTYEVESGLKSLEFIIGTRWAVHDLYSYIMDNDPSVEVNDESYHRIIRDGKILWPEKYTLADIEQLQHEHGANFFLLYLNSADDPSLTDFDLSLVREFKISDGQIVFDEDMRDMRLEERARLKKEKFEAPNVSVKSGMPLGELMNSRLVERLGAFSIRVN